MFGVVLWSDKRERHAVIWCEDHGELAFCLQDDQQIGVNLDAGDWIQFDLATVRHQRVASNPRLVAEGLFCGLADRLSAVASKAAGAVSHRGAEVIPLRRPAANDPGAWRRRRDSSLEPV
ncbi:hypothetical protein [Seohaeicola zhoushanensis]|uniref:Uncharacterized protein n=1 Tax=Seohaeicola zhoushanensis TaxID=1569283 RepID=A0A8J3M994_9RHOB|nr:hypothetical protein [Seohaeicola zhoushanensis]GHF59258.1 hypothetical protein GCM10017056_33510 [Seohaeicola zhoushanensis]